MSHQPALILSLQPYGETPPQRDIAEHEAWMPIEHLRIPFEDKSFLLGFVHALQLTNRQVRALLQSYAEYWERGERYETYQNRKRNTGRRTANTWIMNGAIGFIERRKA